MSGVVSHGESGFDPYNEAQKIYREVAKAPGKNYGPQVLKAKAAGKIAKLTFESKLLTQDQRDHVQREFDAIVEEPGPTPATRAWLNFFEKPDKFELGEEELLKEKKSYRPRTSTADSTSTIPELGLGRSVVTEREIPGPLDEQEQLDINTSAKQRVAWIKQRLNTLDEIPDLVVLNPDSREGKTFISQVVKAFEGLPNGGYIGTIVDRLFAMKTNAHIPLDVKVKPISEKLKNALVERFIKEYDLHSDSQELHAVARKEGKWGDTSLVRLSKKSLEMLEDEPQLIHGIKLFPSGISQFDLREAKDLSIEDRKAIIHACLNFIQNDMPKFKEDDLRVTGGKDKTGDEVAEIEQKIAILNIQTAYLLTLLRQTRKNLKPDESAQMENLRGKLVEFQKVLHDYRNLKQYAQETNEAATFVNRLVQLRHTLPGIAKAFQQLPGMKWQSLLEENEL